MTREIPVVDRASVWQRRPKWGSSCTATPNGFGDAQAPYPLSTEIFQISDSMRAIGIYATGTTSTN
jgi:hypothetical protein